MSKEETSSNLSLSVSIVYALRFMLTVLQSYDEKSETGSRKKEGTAEEMKELPHNHHGFHWFV